MSDECNNCGSTSFITILQTTVESATKDTKDWVKKTVLECDGCGCEGRIFDGAGSTIRTGVLR